MQIFTNRLIFCNLLSSFLNKKSCTIMSERKKNRMKDFKRFQERFDDIHEDLWQYLARTEKPLVLYGMGDGADKILNVLNERGISVSGVFASDGFVRNKVFRGFPVTSYSEVTSRFPDCIVLVSFGTKLAEVIANIQRIAERHEVYAPDVPVFGGGLFTLAYCEQNIRRLYAVYERLCDETSENTFVRALRYRLTGRIDELFACESTVSESYTRLIRPKPSSVYVDIGAYNGDTAAEYAAYAGSGCTVYAFEPDRRNFRKLKAFSEACSELTLHLYNAAAWSKTEKIPFYSRSGRGCGHTAVHADAKPETVDGIRIDEAVDYADYIKIDAEGSDKEALCGAERLIKRAKPTLCVAAYHRTEDYFALPEALLSMCDDYELYFRHFPYIPCWDTNFYFVPKKGENNRE